MIDEKRITDSLIYNEMDAEHQQYYFNYKRQKFLHNIDTFYYSVKLVNDFTKNSDDIYVKRFREYFSKIEKCDFNVSIPLNIPGLKEQLNYRNLRYGYFYFICLEVPEMFTIFMADTVPGTEDDENESTTSEILVQIRSYPLWELGVVKSFEKSFDVLSVILDYFNLTVYEVKENRVDYCWHSNYLQNPSQFFRIDNFINMQVSRYKRIHYEYQFKPNSEYENDYICMGRRSDKCFVRIYLKSKEVVEKSYKPWFFHIWFFNGLISRYDLYVYEECYKESNWNYLDLARLKFYYEYGSNELYLSECSKILNNKVTISPDALSKLADKLTPRPTLITNVEFQTTRKSSKSYILKPFKDNSKYGVCKRIYDYLDNRSIISEYLTHDTLRLVTPDGDSNKSRRDYCNFWKRLRNCKFVDVYIPPKKIKLIREYSRNLNKDVVKHRMLHSCVTFGFYERGINDDSVFKDCAAALLRLNDNDIHNMMQYKVKKKQQLYNKLYDSDISGSTDYEFELVNKKTGECFNSED